ncbi:MAG: DNA-binding protein WhiA [Clostridiales bacterium]|nr:DNA-binding protein WhiA [Clostridiales bacterium]
MMGRTSSFSAGVKGELARLYPEKACCRLAELAAITRLDGTVTLGQNSNPGLYIATEYSAVARKVFRLIKDLFSVEAELTVKRQNRLKRRTVYHIQVTSPEDTQRLLHSLGILSARGQIVAGIKKDIIRNKCCSCSYLRGAFLGSGSVSGPDSDYHLELTAGNEKLGMDLMELANRFPGIQAKISRRKQTQLVYLKESDQIADILTLMGAHGNLLEFENARVLKGMKNQVNRLVNCETANLEKTVDAAVRQTINIKLIDERIGIDALNPSLAQVARLRMLNPEANLKELGEIMTPPLGKSGVNHRLRKIGEIADKLREKQ